MVEEVIAVAALVVRRRRRRCSCRFAAAVVATATPIVVGGTVGSPSRAPAYAVGAYSSWAGSRLLRTLPGAAAGGPAGTWDLFGCFR